VWPAQGEVHGGARARAGQLAHTCIAASNNINLKKKVPTYKKQQRNGYFTIRAFVLRHCIRIRPSSRRHDASELVPVYTGPNR
jgi:hypothetical protein